VELIAYPEYHRPPCGTRIADKNYELRMAWAIQGTDQPAHTSSIVIKRQGQNKMLGTILLVVLILLLFGAFPSWPHSCSWGYGPSGILGVVLIVVIVLLLMGQL
jgi:hypothetical protein